MEKITDLVREILEEEFEKDYVRMEGAGTLAYEVDNILSYCISLFEQNKELHEESKELRWLITGGISEYLDKSRMV